MANDGNLVSKLPEKNRHCHAFEYLTSSSFNPAEIIRNERMMLNGTTDDQKSQDFSKAELRKKLTPVQYVVTQEKVTERAFTGEYYKLKDTGVYACIVCGEEIFSSETKYDSGCGWPTFLDVINSNKVSLKTDFSHVGNNLLLLATKGNIGRTEVSCRKCGGHLGHLFDDGPRPTGKRYCINSSSLNFKGRETTQNRPTENNQQ
ncbi:peptide methionine sulfoxide reductase MsrB-like isoform X3 [Tachypleus tridentatus]|uniref:peptide methionine sulfoxide reductase MsrB-like isoform X3 n=1 Tax=Tachypleus tridentatus TaxID=6853 RepID=UPI003FD11FC5